MTQRVKPFVGSKYNEKVEPEVSALAVAIAEEFVAGLSVTHVSTGREAIELLKVLRFDLLLLSPAVGDMPVWTLAEMVRQFWPWQRWALISPEASDGDVRRAGERGAIGVFCRLSEELAGLRKRGGNNQTNGNEICVGARSASQTLIGKVPGKAHHATAKAREAIVNVIDPTVI